MADHGQATIKTNPLWLQPGTATCDLNMATFPGCLAQQTDLTSSKAALCWPSLQGQCKVYNHYPHLLQLRCQEQELQYTLDMHACRAPCNWGYARGAADLTLLQDASMNRQCQNESLRQPKFKGKSDNMRGIMRGSWLPLFTDLWLAIASFMQAHTEPPQDS